MSALATGVRRMLERAAVELAVRRRRESRREEALEHIALAALLDKHLDPACTFWTSLENKPISMLSGMFQKRRGVRSGLPDVMVLLRHAAGTLVIFIELKSHRGKVSRVQKQIRLEMLPTGAVWWMARSARAALMALHRSGVPFRRKWKPPRLEEWEGPFSDPTQRLPQHPLVTIEWREEKRRCRLRKQIREREAARLAAERDGAGLIDARATAVSASGHGIGADEQRERHGEAKRFGGLHVVDHQLEFGRLLYRQVGRLGIPQNLDVVARSSVQIVESGAYEISPPTKSRLR